MDNRWILELIGYVASALVAISLMMSSVLRLRLINLFGSAAFTLYGLLIGAYPVAVVNLFIVFINLYHLSRMLRRREYFDLLEVRHDSEYLGYFLGFYRREIERFLPGFCHVASARQMIVFVLRDLVPAGLFIGELREHGVLRVEIDFVIPQYRDFKVGRYLFSDRAEFFRARGVREIVTAPGTPEHQKYLRRIGFFPAEAPERAGLYHLAVDPPPHP